MALTTVDRVANTEWAKTILTKVAFAKGDERKALPAIIIYEPQVDRINDMAYFSDSTNTIYLHPKLVTVCRSFGALQDDALAFVLGHELTHFYQESTWDAAGFASIYYVGKSLTPAMFEEEEEADIYGAFLAHLAGYNVQKVIPNLLEGLYEAFHLKEAKIVGNELETRKTAVARICAAIERIIRIYDAGNYFLALGEYEVALTTYEELLEQFETKELLNNAAIAALSAVTASDLDKFTLRYPVAIDLSFSLKNRGTTNTIAVLIKKAENYLIRATHLSPDYLNAFLNLISVYDVKGDKVAAKKLLIAIRPIAMKDEATYTQFRILEGIIAYHDNEKLDAREIFATIAKQDKPTQFATINQWNSRVIAGEQMFIENEYDSPEISDVIGDIDIFEYKLKPASVVFNREVDGLTITLASEWQPSFEFIEYAGANLLLRLQKTQHLPSDYGNNLSLVLVALENETYLITPHTTGVFYTYPNRGLIFNFDKDNQLVEWGIFIR